MYHICNLDNMDNYYRFSMKYGVSYGKKVLSINPYLLEINLSCNMNLAYTNDYIDIYKISNMKKYYASRISEENQISFIIDKEDIGEEFIIEISEKNQYHNKIPIPGLCPILIPGLCPILIPIPIPIPY